MCSGPECTNHLFVAGKKLSSGQCPTRSPWLRHACDGFQLSCCRFKATVCALYCDNGLCWGAKGTGLDPRPTHVVREEQVFLVAHQCGSEQTEKGSIALSPPGFKSSSEKSKILLCSFICCNPSLLHCQYWFFCHKSFRPCLPRVEKCTGEEFTSHDTGWLSSHWVSVSQTWTQLPPWKLSNLIHTDLQ